MYEIKAHKLVIDLQKLTAYSREITSANILEVMAGTTGLMGGDSGHGARTVIRITDLGGTDLRGRVVKNAFGATEIEIVLGGDTELETIIEGLEFILQVLKDGKEA